MISTDICIIGGGASGLAAAVAAKQANPAATIIILEKSEKIGRKLLATGNGRCNLTNQNCENVTEIIAFFHRLGILTRVEGDGRIYPHSGQASDVLQALLLALDGQNIQIETSFAVDDLSAQLDAEENPSFEVGNSNRNIRARQVLLATGGKAAPQFGCTGDGYRIAKNLEHPITRMLPALSPVECVGNFSTLRGIRVKAQVFLMKKGECIASETGEVQFTEYGLSGICIMNLSRLIRLTDCNFTDFAFSLDFIPTASLDEVKRELLMRKENLGSHRQQNILLSMVPGSLAAEIQKSAGMAGSPGYIRDLSQEEITSLAKTLKGLTLPITGVKGWRFAQCTSGGISWESFSPHTMESRLIKGLFFAGELIDYDGPCGGYNLHHAWQTGIQAGRSMAANV